MSAWLLVFGLAVIAAPPLVRLYLRRLPVAPVCPACHATAREIDVAADVLRLVPVLATTFVGECGCCGWRGRMRWRWAPRWARRDRR